MRLDLLLAREPFPEVFSETLQAYLQQRHGWHGQVRWTTEQKGKQQGLLVNEKLNLIFPSQVADEQLRTLAAEYAYHPSPMRRLFQGLYVRYAVTRPVRRWLASARVHIDPWWDTYSSWVILGGNHSVRIVDLERDSCVVIRKAGFRRDFLDAAVDVRVQYPDLPGPKLLERDSTAGWYAEERVRGLPLDRVADVEQAEKSLTAAKQTMASLYERTATEEPLHEWVVDRLQRICRAVDSLPPVFREVVRKRILAAADQLAKRLGNRAIATAVVPTAATHGDFQPGNILIPNQSEEVPVYLIDWEYSAVRCRWYDAMVFDLRSRFPAGLAQRVTSWIGNEAGRGETLTWCGCGNLEHWAAGDLVAGFLLDDLLLRLHENAIPGLRQENSGLCVFLDELDALQRTV